MTQLLVVYTIFITWLTENHYTLTDVWFRPLLSLRLVNKQLSDCVNEILLYNQKVVTRMYLACMYCRQRAVVPKIFTSLIEKLRVPNIPLQSFFRSDPRETKLAQMERICENILRMNGYSHKICKKTISRLNYNQIANVRHDDIRNRLGISRGPGRGHCDAHIALTTVSYDSEIPIYHNILLTIERLTAPSYTGSNEKPKVKTSREDVRRVLGLQEKNQQKSRQKKNAGENTSPQSQPPRQQKFYSNRK